MILDAFGLCPALSAFQAGGGGGFGGGGGGGGGVDSDSLWILYYLLRLAFEAPLIGVPLLGGVVIVGLIGMRKGWWVHQSRTIRRSRSKRLARASQNTGAVLRATDPDFDEQRFRVRVRDAFKKAQSSWCAQDLEPLRPFVSDGVYERFSLQIEQQRKEGWRQGMGDLRTRNLTLLQVDVGNHFETITVRVEFRADIHRIGLESGKKLTGSSLPRKDFAECWSFLRRKGAQSIKGEGLIEGKCPNCGAPLAINQSARCGHCECLARSGAFDWVLTEITQASEWRPEGQIRGLVEYVHRDPGMNVPMLEDRASVAFWRKVGADVSGKVEPLLRVANENFCEHYATELTQHAEGERAFLDDCAVGSVRTLRVAAGDERDRAVVQIVWDGRPARIDGKGKRKLEKQRRLRRTLFVFERKTGQETRLDDAFTTTHCRKCGAHETDGTQPTCEFCGAPRTGDRSAWLLAEVADRGSDRARKLLAGPPVVKASVQKPAQTAKQSTTDLLMWATALVRSDDHVDTKEADAVRSLGKRTDVPPERVEELLAQGPGDAVPEPVDANEGRAWLFDLAALALADGTLSRRERAFLQHAAQRLGVSTRELERAIRDARNALFRKSRGLGRQAEE
jgi:uncharacterized tellurite resistance protein B-like protein